MTDRLYYRDPYLRTFEATVQTVAPQDDRLLVTLDRTAFYPSSGGQPFDTGTLGGFTVVDVVDQDDGAIAHVIELRTQNPELGTLNPEPRTRNPVSGTLNPIRPGSTVSGVVDWRRRHDHMQQHTGQHVLSAAFDRLFDARTVSVHLGADASTIDLAREMTPGQIAEAESEANRVVWEDRAVAIRFVTAEQAATLPLRKEPARGGLLRLIDIEDFDLSACGGTHVARTGGIGVIAVASWERFKGGQRLEFLCGGRALGRFRSMRDSMTSAVRLLSVLPSELPASIERMQAEANDQKRTVVALQTELSRFRAEELAAGAEQVRLKADATVSLVLRALDADANGLKALASAITAKPGFIVALFSSARPALVVIARSAAVGVGANQVLSALTAKFGGRGGGKPEMAQGGGLEASTDDILAAARTAILSA